MWQPTYPVPLVRTVTHLHGQHSDEVSDGAPTNWFGPGESSEVYTYPNQQAPALLWYHDHALGVTRANAQSGLSGMYIIRDPAVEQPLNLPSGDHEVLVIVSDKTFTDDGQLFYPGPEWAPEYYGDTISVNGKAWPYFEVQPHRYRFRLVNAANARYFSLYLDNGDKFTSIGGDGGYLPAPVSEDLILLSPGERADFIIDFSAYAPGENIILKNNAAAPYPGGDSVTNRTCDVLQFRVVASTTTDNSSLPSTLPCKPYNQPSDSVRNRSMTLVELDFPSGEPSAVLLNNLTYGEPVTEDPYADSVEIWEIINLTDDNHPIHIHNADFRILWRREFNVTLYEEQQVLQFTAEPVLPLPYEAGWKDTIRADPEMVTSIIIHFAPVNGTFVWHCHILEHEDNEMMRPLLIRPQKSQM